MLAIKLKMVGRRNQRTFRVIVQEARAKLGGKFVDDLGWYNPHTNQFKVNKDRVDYWIKSGAQPTDSVVTLLKKVETSELTTYEKREGRKKNKGPKPEAGAEAPAGAPEGEAAQEGETPETESGESSQEISTEEPKEEKAPEQEQQEEAPVEEKPEEKPTEGPAEEKSASPASTSESEAGPEASQGGPVEEEKEDK